MCKYDADTFCLAKVILDSQLDVWHLELRKALQIFTPLQVFKEVVIMDSLEDGYDCRSKILKNLSTYSIFI